MYLKKLLGILLIVNVASEVLAKDKFILNGYVVAINKQGELIRQLPKYGGDNNKLEVTILGFDRSAELTGDGKFKFSLDKDLYPTGKPIIFSVNKRDSRIVIPPDGLSYVPSSAKNIITLVLGYHTVTPTKVEKKNYIFAVQVLNTQNETRIIHLKNKLAKDVKGMPVYIERYMVGNMPNNGFEYKLKVGSFVNNKAEAIAIQKYLKRRYKKFADAFVTLKGHR